MTGAQETDGVYGKIRMALAQAFNAAYEAFALSLKGSRLPSAMVDVIIADMERVLRLAHDSAVEAVDTGFAAANDEVQKN